MPPKPGPSGHGAVKSGASEQPQQKITPTALLRVQKDLKAIHDDPTPFICVTFNSKQPSEIHALVCGPVDTPYEGGFFHFYVHTPHDYPNNPPSVKLLTTGQGVVRFNPNLYACGKVCLSIIGTWQGPSWMSSMSLQTLLVSIQSLMNEKPYCNEPGLEKNTNRQPIEAYNDFIRHETLRVAVCDQVNACLNGLEYSSAVPGAAGGGGSRGAQMAAAQQNTAYYHSSHSAYAQMPASLRRAVLRCFPLNYQFYLDLCDSNAKLNGKAMPNNVAGVQTSTTKFDFAALRTRVVELKPRVDAWLAKNPDPTAETGGAGDASSSGCSRK